MSTSAYNKILDDQDFANYQTIDTGIGDISYSTENLLDQQVMEALEALIKKKGSLKVLQLLTTCIDN